MTGRKMLFTADHDDARRALQNFIAAEINPFVDEWEKAELFPAHELFKKLGDLGFLGLNKPVEFGGQGLDYTIRCGRCSCSAGRDRVMSGSEISSREQTSDRGGLPGPVKRSTMSSSGGGALAPSRRMSVVLRKVRDAHQERAPHHEDNRRDGK
jgi:hypothetical protein